MRIRPAHLLLCGALFASTLAACSSTSKSPTTTTGATSSTTAAAAASGSGGNGSLVQYCQDVAAFVKKAEPILKSKDRTAAVALQVDAQKLGQEAATLGASLATETDAQHVADQAKLPGLREPVHHAQQGVQRRLRHSLIGSRRQLTLRGWRPRARSRVPRERWCSWWCSAWTRSSSCAWWWSRERRWSSVPS